MRQGAETMEQHGRELNYQNQGEEEHKHQTDGLQLEVLFRDVHLGRSQRVSFSSSVRFDVTFGGMIDAPQ